MKKTILFVIALLTFSQAVFAATATSTATTSGSPTQTVEKIKNLVKENLTATEVDIQKEAINKSIIGYSGKVKTVGTKNITIETEKDLLQVLIAETSTIFKGTTEIKTSSIAIGDNLLVYGQKNKEDVYEAKHIYVLTAIDDKNIVVSKAQVATISEIDLKKKIFSLTINGETTSYTLSKKNTVRLEDFKDGDTIFGITKKYQGKFSLSKAIKI